MPRRPTILVPVLLAAAVLGCRREDRGFRPDPPFAGDVRYRENYEGNAYALSEGKRLYAAFNCVGCHAHGGGAIGPPLADGEWVYGGEPDDIFDTLSRGRPDGMPSFGGVAREPGIHVAGTVPEHQRWQLVAYVRSLSGLAPQDAASGRDDHMQAKPPEQSTDRQPPVVVPPPDAGDHPR